MTETVRLAKRVVELLGCSRSEADRYVEGGWVSVDGVVIDRPQHPVGNELIEVDPAAQATAVEPATILFHRAGGADQVGTPENTISADNRWPEDGSGLRLAHRQLLRQKEYLPLDPIASGLAVLTQDDRVGRRLLEHRRTLEQEYLVEVSGEIAAYGLQRLGLGLRLADRTLPACKVSWQSEARLRFAIKDPQPGQLALMCAEVGLSATSLRRLRIGRISLARMPPGQWRFLPASERF